MVYWITGLSGAGKTTIGKLFYERMVIRNQSTVFLDGDTLRETFGNDLGYAEEDRRRCAKRYSNICKLLADQGMTVIICTISMYDEIRDWNRKNIKDYFEIYVRVPIDILNSRNQKNLYAEAQNGIRADVVGAKGQFEEPRHPDLIIDNDGSRAPFEIVDEICLKAGMSHNKGVVLYSQRVEVVESYQERRDCADQRIPELIYECGYIPVALPNCGDMVSEIIETVHPRGIILTGGNSLVSQGGNAPERDATDHALIECAIKYEIPLYGFCRGMQSVLDFFGEDLCKVEGHVAVHHQVRGEIMEEVNSYHNQGCIQLKDHSPLEIISETEDGVIEAIRHTKYHVMATMWHPEREYPFRESDKKRIIDLFDGRTNE